MSSDGDGRLAQPAKKNRKKRLRSVGRILRERRLQAAEFRWYRVVFVVWGLLNTLAAVAFLFAVLSGDVEPAQANVAYIVLFVLAFVPFGQVACECAGLGLNADETSAPETRQGALRRWKTVFRRTPIASSFMLLLLLATVAMVVFGGGTSIEIRRGHGAAEGNLHGETQRNRLLMAVAVLFFCYAPVYMNAFVLPKCKDLAKS